LVGAFAVLYSPVIHEKLSVILTYAYSAEALGDMMNRFQGEWKYLNKTIYEVGRERATLAFVEMSVLIRILDDDVNFTQLTKLSGTSVGHLLTDSGKKTALSPRDMTNKVIHADELTWDFSVSGAPKLVCRARADEKRSWATAEVDIRSLAAFCGQLMH
jgi:predicted GNAT family acetyltransferase